MIFKKNTQKNQQEKLLQHSNLPYQLRCEDFFASSNNSIAVAKRDHQPAFEKHYHEFDELVIVAEGNGLHIWNNEVYPITCGDILYINHDDIHAYQAVNNLRLDNLLYNRDKFSFASTIANYLPDKNSSQSTRFWQMPPSYLRYLAPIIQQLSAESQKTDAYSIHFAESIFLQVLITIHRAKQEKAQMLSSPLSQLDLLFDTLHNSISQSFNFELFCKENAFIARTLRRSFKKLTGFSINEYLQHLKLCKAMSLLQNTTQSISVIAAECGYDDSNYFSLVFKKAMHQTPSQFRQQANQNRN